MFNWLIKIPRNYFYYYALYFLMCFFYMTVFTSTIAFFHFLIEHNMLDIKSWIDEQRWPLAIIVKTLALVTSFIFISTNMSQGQSLKEVLKQQFGVISSKIIVMGVSLVLLMLYITAPVYSNSWVFSIDEIIIKTFFVSIFFSIDIILIALLMMIMGKSFSDKSKLSIAIFHGTLFAMMNIVIFQIERQAIPLIALIFIINFYLVIRSYNWGESFIFNLIFSASVIILLGLDPLSNTIISPLETNVDFTWSLSFCLTLISLLFLSPFLKKRKPNIFLG